MEKDMQIMNRNLLMVLGPTEIEHDILEIGAHPQEYMRTEDFSLCLKRIFSNLQYVFQTNSPICVFSSSGTGAMEAAVGNFVSPGDTILYINGGTFGQRWGAICTSKGINAHELRVPFGDSVCPHLVEKYLKEKPSVKAVYATLNETSSGALSDIKSIGEIVSKYPHIIFVVDCVSGLIVEPMKMDFWHIDVAVSSSQKAMAIPPGLSFMAVSDKALAIAQGVRNRPYYFDVIDYIKDFYRNQTPYTPAVGLLLQLDERLKKIRNTGLDNIIEYYRKLTGKIRDGLAELELYTYAKYPANCVSGYDTFHTNALDIVSQLRKEYHIEIAPSGGERANHFFRVGNFGNVTQDNVDYFLESFKNIWRKNYVR